MRIAVAGGTGLVGRFTAQSLRDAGHEVVIMARSTGVDLTTGGGLAEALDGVDAAVDVTNVVTMKREAAVGFFETATRNLIAAAAKAGTPHVLALSIVGLERVPIPYYAGKLAQERALTGSDVPYSILRATQFHEFGGQVLGRVRGPVALVPAMRTQPVAAREVGQVLAELAAAPPSGTTELAGPRVENLADMARRTLRARGSRRAVLQVRLPGAGGKAMANGGNLPTGDYRKGTETFDDWVSRAAG